MGNKYETEKGEVYIYDGASQHDDAGCSCGGNCACKSGGGKEQCECGGSCNCK